MNIKVGSMLKHCKGSEILVHMDLGDVFLYSKSSLNECYEGVDFFVRPKEMFFDKHSSGISRFEYRGELDDGELKLLDEYNEYTRYVIARHSESLEYCVVDLLEKKILNIK